MREALWRRGCASSSGGTAHRHTPPPYPGIRSHASAADDPDARELVSPAQHRDDPPQSANQIVTVEGHQ